MIFKTLGGRGQGAPGEERRRGGGRRRSWLERIGASDAGVVIKNGSGLFDANRVTRVRAPCELLRWAWRDPAIQPEYVAQLSVGGVDGTLHKRFRQELTRRRVRAKTGTLDDVIALSGYVLRDGGEARSRSRSSSTTSPASKTARATPPTGSSSSWPDGPSRTRSCRGGAGHLTSPELPSGRRDRGRLSRTYSRMCLRILPSACSWSWRIRSRDRLYLSPISLSVSSSSSSRPKRQRMMRDSMGVSVVEQAPDLVAPLLVGERARRARARPRPGGSR